MSYPDAIVSETSSFIKLETVSYTRYVQPAASLDNTAKALLVYREADDGVARKTSGQITYPGSPVQIQPSHVYIIRADINEALQNPDQAVGNVRPEDRNLIMALISDEYRPVYGCESHFAFETSDPTRLPGAAGTVVCARFPNPGAKRIGFWFATEGSGNTVTAEVFAVGRSVGLLNTQTVIGAGHPEGVHVVGTADVVPVGWQVNLSGGGVASTKVGMSVSYNEEA